MNRPNSTIRGRRLNPLPDWAKVGAAVIVIRRGYRGPELATFASIASITAAGLLVVEGRRFRLYNEDKGATEYQPGIGQLSHYLVPDTGPNRRAYRDALKAKVDQDAERAASRARYAKAEAERLATAERRRSALQRVLDRGNVDDDQREALEHAIAQVTETTD